MSRDIEDTLNTGRLGWSRTNAPLPVFPKRSVPVVMDFRIVDNDQDQDQGPGASSPPPRRRSAGLPGPCGQRCLPPLEARTPEALSRIRPVRVLVKEPPQLLEAPRRDDGSRADRRLASAFRLSSGRSWVADLKAALSWEDTTCRGLLSGASRRHFSDAEYWRSASMAVSADGKGIVSDVGRCC